MASISHQLRCLTISSPLQLDERILQEKLALLKEVSSLSSQIFSPVASPFLPKDASSILSTVKENEKHMEPLLETISKKFRRLHLNTLSSMNLHSSVCSPSKPRTSTLTDTLDLELPKTLNGPKPSKELITLGFESLSDVTSIVTKAFSYVTTPLALLSRSKDFQSKKNAVAMPKSTFKFIKTTLEGNRFQVKKQLGKSNFSIVNLVQTLNEVCVLKKPYSSPSEKDTVLDRKPKPSKAAITGFEKEVNFYMLFKHPNILSAKAISSHGLYLELLEGDLTKLIGSQTLTTKEALSYFLDILRALRYIHSMGYTYKDLKPANVLISKGVAQLCDFGLTTSAENDTAHCGSLYFIAPEILHPSQKNFSTSVDTWSFGVLMFHVITGGSHPYPTTHPDESTLDHSHRVSKMVFGKACQEKLIFSFVNKSYLQRLDPQNALGPIITACLNGNPQKRPSLEEIETQLTKLLHSS